MIAIGVDDGIHLIHRYRIEKNLSVALRDINRAILLTTLTTVVAFGTYIFAKYRGFEGFGLILVIALTLSYLITVFALPSLIYIVDRKKK